MGCADGSVACLSTESGAVLHASTAAAADTAASISSLAVNKHWVVAASAGCQHLTFLQRCPAADAATATDQEALSLVGTLQVSTIGAWVKERSQSGSGSRLFFATLSEADTVLLAALPPQAARRWRSAVPCNGICWSAPWTAHCCWCRMPARHRRPHLNCRWSRWPTGTWGRSSAWRQQQTVHTCSAVGRTAASGCGRQLQACSSL